MLSWITCWLADNKELLLAVGEAWIISGTGNSIIVKISSGGEFDSVPAGEKKNATSSERYRHLKNMNKIVTITAKKLDTFRGERSWGEIHERPEMISHQ